MTQSQQRKYPQADAPGTHAPLATCFVLLSIIMAGTWIADIWRVSGNESPGPLQVRIDPNCAPWYELTALPGIGPSRARDIVAHRIAHRHAVEDRVPAAAEVNATAGQATAAAFRTAEDLTAVRGIGPRTMQRIAPHLRFPHTADQPHADGPWKDDRAR